MHVERSDGQRFIIASARESLPGVLPRRKRLDKVHQYAESHKASRVVVLPDGRDYTAVFAQESGQLLSETARQWFDDPNVVWVDQFEPGRYLLVVLSGSEVVDEQLIKDDNELDAVALMMFLESGAQPVVYGSGGLPGAFAELLEQAGIECHHSYDESLLDKLPLLEELATQPVGDYLRAEQKDIQRKHFRVALAALVPVAIVALLALWPEADSSESVIPFTDPYADYRRLYEQPPATEVINEIYNLLTQLENLASWNLDHCDYEQRRLVCQLSPALGARSGLLNGMENYLQRPTQSYLVGDTAHVVIDLALESGTEHGRRVLIVNRKAALRTFRDRLVFLPVPSAIDIKQPVDQDLWETQWVQTLKQGTGLYHIVDLSHSAKGLPVRVQTMAIKRTEAGYEFKTNFLVFGGKSD